MIKKIVGCVRYFGVSTIQSIEVVALPCLAIQQNDYLATISNYVVNVVKWLVCWPVSLN